MKNAIILLSIYILAGIFDYGAHLSFLIRYVLMALLFFSFLKVKNVGKPDIQRVASILFFMFFIGTISYFLLVNLYRDLAVSIFMVAITPTALASIVMIDILGGDKSHAASNVLVTNVFIIFMLPLLMPLLVQNIAFSVVLEVMQATFITFFAPFIAAFVVKLSLPRFTRVAATYNIGFYAWATLMYLSVSKSVYFLKCNKNIGSSEVIILILIVVIICIMNFAIGRIIGGKKLSLESSLALGHKNNGFSVWFCLAYINPLVALGPALYVLFQNLYLIFLVSRKAKIRK